MGLVYFLLGKRVDGGNNLLIEEIHDPKQVVPLRMVPLVLGGTVISHLFGASVGREGTAVQMGGRSGRPADACFSDSTKTIAACC